MSRRRSTSRLIERPADLVWELLATYRHWPHWGPSVRDVEVEGDHVVAGATGMVITFVGLKLPFEITETQPGRYWGWRVGGISATGHLVIPITNSRCLVEFDVPVVFSPYLVILKWALRRIERMAESADPSR